MAQQGGFVRGQIEQGHASRRALQMLRLRLFHLSVIRPLRQARRCPSPQHVPNQGPGASHMNGTETIVEAGPYPYTSPHDGNAHRIRALFHRPAGSGRPASGAPGAWRRRGSHLHQSRPHRHDPRPPRPSPPCAKATPWSSRNSTGRAGPSRMRAPSPISFGNEA